jgi:hypothetical protein
LEQVALRVLRFGDVETLRNPDAVVQALFRELTGSEPSPSPSP